MPLAGYLELLDWTARQLVPGKRGATPSDAPPILERSFYAKDASGSVSETELQHILGAPIDLELPARVGVVPLADAFDPKGPVSIAVRGTASRDLARALLGHANFSQVSDVSTELPNAGGIEGLRVIAARYRLRYLLLYSERFEDATHLNGWALTYPTIIGMFHVLPTVIAQNGVWIMNRKTLGALRTLKDSTGRFIMLDPITAGMPATLLGRPIVEAVDMPDVAANAYPIMFGDLSGYRIVDRVGLSILRDPYTLSDTGQVKFTAYKRTGGDVSHPDRFIKLKVAA